MTYAEAAELTWPQLMHALAIGAGASEDDSIVAIEAAQEAVFDRIVARRRCLPIDLLAMPLGDLVATVTEEGGRPSVPPLIAGLKRYVDGRQ
jgi:hypothetical protein